MKRVLTIIGTRPEAIKMAPVIQVLACRDRFESKLCLTGQHRALLDRSIFSQPADYELNLAEASLTDVAAMAIRGIGQLLRTWKPDVVLVQGDTTSAFAGTLAAFYEGVPVGHVEAGLRTGDLGAPWPEEGHRQAIDRIASWMFAPTTCAYNNLLAEGVPASRVYLVGNTAIDALRLAKGRLPAAAGRRRILATIHRRENQGEPLRRICNAIQQVARRWPDVDIVMPLHPNPQIREPISILLAGIPNISIIEPLNHVSLVALMQQSLFILTDSGGLQEEAPYLGKPILVLRDTTERPEGLAAGTARLVGSDPSRIVAACSELLDDNELLKSMSIVHTPYGDGFAAERIVDILTTALESTPSPSK